MTQETIDNYPELAKYMLEFRRDPSRDDKNYLKFIRALEALKKSAIEGDDTSHDKLTKMGFVFEMRTRSAKPKNKFDAEMIKYYMTKESFSLNTFFKKITDHE